MVSAARTSAGRPSRQAMPMQSKRRFRWIFIGVLNVSGPADVRPGSVSGFMPVIYAQLVKALVIRLEPALEILVMARVPG